MASLAVAILDGLSEIEKTCWRLNDILARIHDSTHRVNEVSQQDNLPLIWMIILKLILIITLLFFPFT